LTHYGAVAVACRVNDPDRKVYAVVAELDEWRRSRETAEATSAKGAV
jgi:hypothetical protein